MPSNIERSAWRARFQANGPRFIEWLTQAGYEPVPMLGLDSVGRDLITRPIEALIADVSLVSGGRPPATRPDCSAPTVR